MGEKISVAQAAALTGRQERLLRSWIASGKLAATKAGHAWVIDSDKLARVCGVQIDPEQLTAVTRDDTADGVHAALLQRLEVLEQEVAALQQRMALAEQERANRDAELAILSQRLEAMAHEAVDHGREMLALQERLELAERGATTHRRAVAALQQRMETLEQDVAAQASAARTRRFPWLRRAGSPQPS